MYSIHVRVTKNQESCMQPLVNFKQAHAGHNLIPTECCPHRAGNIEGLVMSGELP